MFMPLNIGTTKWLGLLVVEICHADKAGLKSHDVFGHDENAEREEAMKKNKSLWGIALALFIGNAGCGDNDSDPYDPRDTLREASLFENISFEETSADGTTAAG